MVVWGKMSMSITWLAPQIKTIVQVKYFQISFSISELKAILKRDYVDEKE